MGDGSISDFFSFLDKQNNAIAEREAKEPQVSDSGVGVDRYQIERDAKRREEAKWWLGAKPRARSRPKRGKIIRGHMENPGAGE